MSVMISHYAAMIMNDSDVETDACIIQNKAFVTMFVC